MKFTTTLFAIASAIAIASAAPSLPDDAAVSRVPRDELLPRQTCRGETGQFSLALTAARLRFIQHEITYMEPRQAQEQFQSILESPHLELSAWETNLLAICHLFRLSREADHFIARYAEDIWAKTQDESVTYAIIEFTNYSGPLPQPSPMPRTPLLLSSTERQRLEESFLIFDVYRHTIHYDTTLLREIKINRPIRMPITWSSFITEGLGGHDWSLRAFQSIFGFIFNKYHFLVHRVANRLESQKPSGKLLRAVNTLGANRVWQFLQRTQDEELRFVAYLCSHGYFLLLSLEHMDWECLEHFIMTMFLWKCIPKAQSDSSLMMEERLGTWLEALSTVANRDLGSYMEPRTNRRYFWDRERLHQLEDRAIAAVEFLHDDSGFLHADSGVRVASLLGLIE
ncbi:hypothetical protein FALBO_10479 [Fusarium albosuccineum]|uniref:Uncharacterized protein n=1 Tax=Fusarium albosuccineum TaxID=1237068 RepID=A0A8H4P821_9HYPO|nr:hypothetical protein FALBO_10479 [Fusarium albosuccineum]